MYEGQRYVRHRSVERICDEIEYAIERIPGITAVNFADDNFAAMNVRRMGDFLETYVNRVGLPFSCTLSPAFADSQRLDMLVRSRVFRISMGIQSASERVLKMYKRRVPVQAARDAVQGLEAIRPLMNRPRIVSYHFIVDNPYETPEDKVATLGFILNLPRRESALCFSLVPFPGTAMYEMMQRDGLIVDERDQVYTKDFSDLLPSFTRYWLYLFYGGVPDLILRVLLKAGLVQAVDRGRPKWLFRLLYWGLEQGYRCVARLRQLSRKDHIRGEA